MRELIVLAKAPLPGLAKTRLIGHAGWTAESVGRLADAFVRDTLRVCERVSAVRLRICFAPAGADGYFRALAPHARLVPQVEGDLGARLSAAFEAAFAEGADRAVVLGTDTPHLEPAVLEAAFDALERSQCVLGPATDGGYYLLGLRSRQPSLFQGVAWSTEQVLAQTAQRARAAGLTVATVAESFDIDLPADLERLERQLDSAGQRCPHTARLLAQHRAAAAGTRSNAEGA